MTKYSKFLFHCRGYPTLPARPRLSAVWRRLPIRGCLAALLCAATVLHAQEIRVGGTGGALGTMRLLGQAFANQYPQMKVTVLPSLGSGGGIRALLAHAIDLAVSSRALTPAEISAGAVATEYARTPFVFATAPSIPVTKITSSELIDIYSGRTTHWPGGSRIRIILRPTGDSDSTLIKSISPAMSDAKTLAESRQGMAFAVTDQDSADALERVPGALGPTTLAQIIAEGRELRALQLDGVAPSVAALADGSYRLHKTLLMVVAANPSGATRQFMAFVRSPRGRQILQQNGHWVP